MFNITYSPTVEDTLSALKDVKRGKKISKAFDNLARDPTYPGLRCRPVKGTEPTEWGKPVWFGDIENHTPGAWRFIWAYGPAEGELTVLWVGPHP